MNKCLILGGYGNFGSIISEELARASLSIIIAGRDINQANNYADALSKKYSNAHIESLCLDVNKDFAENLVKIKPFIVINTCGPFQAQDYSIAEACIKSSVHYIDLADARDFVNNITELDRAAKNNNCLVVSGASTVPCLTAAVLDNYKEQFSVINSLVYGITPGQDAPRGLATTQSILSYVGKPLKPFAGGNEQVFGWQNIYRQMYPVIGTRWMANCDIPDLDLLPKLYNIKSIRFSAGMESWVIHLGIWLLSWFVRLGLPLNLAKHAKFLLKLSKFFDWLGTDKGGMHMIIKGNDKSGKPLEVKWFIIATRGDGPHIPTAPAIILTKKLYQDQIKTRGAGPCIGMISLQEYLDELKNYSIKVFDC